LNSLIDDDDEDPPRRGYAGDDDPPEPDREISLGMPTILGIFFALALVCAGFFAFGYNMGRKSAQNAPGPADAVAGTAVSSAKPAAGSLFGQPAVLVAKPADDLPAPPTTAPTTQPDAAAQPDATQTPSTPSSSTPSSPTPSIVKNAATPANATTAIGNPPTSTPQPATGNQQPATGFMVQIAAVSSQEIADIEVAALKKDGYDVVIRHEPQDQLLHIQVGPFANRKDAEAMRANVLAHGFNAIVK